MGIDNSNYERQGNRGTMRSAKKKHVRILGGGANTKLYNCAGVYGYKFERDLQAGSDKNLRVLGVAPRPTPSATRPRRKEGMAMEP